MSRTSEITPSRHSPLCLMSLAIIGIFRRSQRAECLLLHHIGKADDVVERRAQLVAHIGEKFGFGPVRGLGLGLLLQIFLREIGELLRLQFQGLPRFAQIGDGRHEAAFGVHQLLLVAFERGDVGADRNIAAVLGAPFVDLQPAAIAKPRLVGARPGKRPLAKRDLSLDHGGRSFRHHLRIRRSGGDRVARQMMEFLELGIAHDEPVARRPTERKLPTPSRSRREGVGRPWRCVRRAPFVR